MKLFTSAICITLLASGLLAGGAKRREDKRGPLAVYRPGDVVRVLVTLKSPATVIAGSLQFALEEMPDRQQTLHPVRVENSRRIEMPDVAGVSLRPAVE